MMEDSEHSKDLRMHRIMDGMDVQSKDNTDNDIGMDAFMQYATSKDEDHKCFACPPGARSPMDCINICQEK